MESVKSLNMYVLTRWNVCQDEQFVLWCTFTTTMLRYEHTGIVLQRSHSSVVDYRTSEFKIFENNV